jgi:hypothetical protein
MNETTVIEVSGVKLEVDLRTAKRIDTLRVGSRVKLLIKPSYGDSKVHPGVVVGFEPFPSNPSILVAYMEETYASAEIKVRAVNATTADIEMVASIDDELFDRNEVLRKFDKQIAAKRREIETIEEQRRYFETNFSAYWRPVTADSQAS